jgi:hypothetical protein
MQEAQLKGDRKTVNEFRSALDELLYWDVQMRRCENVQMKGTMSVLFIAVLWNTKELPTNISHLDKLGETLLSRWYFQGHLGNMHINNV